MELLVRHCEIGVLIYPAFVGSPSGGHAALHDSLVATSKHVADNLVVGSTVVWDLCRRADEIVAGVTKLVEIFQTHHVAAVSHDELQMRNVLQDTGLRGVHLFVPLNRSSKVGGISEMKININLFCISLDLHYLCTPL